MKLSTVRVQVLNDVSAAALTVAVNNWLVAQNEATFLAIDYCESAGNYSALITYTV